MTRISTSTAAPNGANWPTIYTGIALTTLATLLLELTLTRIYSVIFYYHFAFLAISVALFGLGAGGVFSYVVSGWPGKLYAKLGRLAAINSIVVICSLAFLLSRKGSPDNLELLVIYFFSALPFLLAGAIVSLLISETIEKVERVYFFDLLGAAAGCLMLIWMLDTFGGPNTVIAVAVLFAATSAIWYNMAREFRGRVAAVGLALALTALFIFNIRSEWIDIRYAKGQVLANEQFVKWNSFSRIAVSKEGGTNLPNIVIDADAATGIFTQDLNTMTEDAKKRLLSSGPGLPYRLKPGAKALVIGPGGGWDVARGLASGSKDITGVEINPIIATTIMREKFSHLSHELYLRPEIRIAVEDGRSFVRRSPEKYQVIQATLVDTWASTAAGAFSLSENNLYTADAFADYMSHLSDDGILAFTRWGFDPPRESLRLLSLTIDALNRLGEFDVAKHVVVAREGSNQIKGWGATDTVILSRKPMTPDFVQRAVAAMNESNMEIVYYPGTERRNPFQELLTTGDREKFYANYHYNVTPVNDNRPFFFYTVQPRDVWSFFQSKDTENADYKINRAVPMLFGVLFVSVIATIVTLLLPPLVLGQKLPSDRKLRVFLLYFVCLGAGYIMIQVSLIQKFVLLLGHPTYALTVIIFSMLLSSGLGSFYSKRIVRENPERLRIVLLMIVILVPVLGFFAGLVSDVGPDWPMALKMAATVAVITPLGFLMGIPFPTGLATLEGWEKTAVRWGWSMNAASSVLGSALAIFFAIYLGLYQTLVLGGLLYLVAAWIYRKTAEKAMSRA
ncbi:hypothetical protein [Bryobacter aggregatus]|uniref:hypothetical protein n=1 Tax=Bryobacter aggregatus TaxID=360054 RepID=UPI000689D193|nr:hypothetical protein [Bryobacter aggregatus]